MLNKIKFKLKIILNKKGKVIMQRITTSSKTRIKTASNSYRNENIKQYVIHKIF